MHEARRLGGPRGTAGAGEGLAVRAGTDGLDELAVHGCVDLAGTQPGDVVIAGTTVEHVDLVVRRKCVQDVVAVAAELVIDAGATPQEVTLRTAVHGVVTGAAVKPTAGVAARGERVVAIAAPRNG